VVECVELVEGYGCHLKDEGAAVGGGNGRGREGVG